ncbi:MAG: YvcK family protein [bacterium]|nr:YvcK family protein [bacterium]
MKTSNGMKKVVTIGGGTGSYTVLRGLKKFPLDITAVVSMFDSGGSAGVLRDEFGTLPPGDVRRCIVALSEGKKRPVLRDLFNFRFEQKGSPLNGHSFGNLLLLALSKIYGGEIEGIRKASELLDLKGKVLPVSLDNAHVHATLEDGTEIVGEANIDVPKHNGDLKIKDLRLKPDAHIFGETRTAILEADFIIIGPGDIYTSIIPNLLVKGMREALRKSKGKTVAICNLMTKWGETNSSAASDMMRELLKYSGLKKFDYIICNTQKMDPNLVASYAKEKKYPVMCDARLRDCAKEVITGGFFWEVDIARHDSGKIAKVLAEL